MPRGAGTAPKPGPSLYSSHQLGSPSPIPTEVPSSSGLIPDIPLEPQEPDYTFLGLENCLWFKLSTVNLSPDTVAKNLSFPGAQHCVCFHTYTFRLPFQATLESVCGS